MTGTLSWAFGEYIGFRIYLLGALAILAALAWPFASRVGMLRGGRVWTAMTAFALICAAGHMIAYALTPNFLDYAEPLIAVMAGNFLAGAPLYNEIGSSGSMVSSLYGPATFLAEAASIHALPSVLGAKLPGVIAGALTVVCVALALPRREASDRAIATGCLAMLLLQLYAFRHYWFWNRPDSMLVLTAAVAALAAARLRPAAALAAVGVAAGVAANLKLHAPIYFVPIGLALLARIDGGRQAFGAAVLAAGLAIATFAAPFLLPGISFADYIANLAMAARHGLSAELILESLFYAAAFLAPPVLLLWMMPRGERDGADRLMVWALCGAAVAMAVASGKPGSGAPHMMPFVPFSVVLTARLAGRLGAAVALPPLRLQLVALAAAVLPIWSYNVYEIRRFYPDFQHERAMAAEARDLFVRYPRAEMAHAGDGYAEPTTYHRVQAAFAGHRLRFDVVNWLDLRFAGVPADEARPLMQDCQVPAWILPKQRTPFGGTVRGEPIFDAEFVGAFRDNYRLARAGESFDVWTCGDGATAAQHAAAGAPGASRR